MNLDTDFIRSGAEKVSCRKSFPSTQNGSNEKIVQVAVSKTAKEGMVGRATKKSIKTLLLDLPFENMS